MMKQLQIKILLKNLCTCTCMFVGIKNFTGPWFFGVWYFQQFWNKEHQGWNGNLLQFLFSSKLWWLK